MRFSTFIKHCELMQSRLETINKQVTTLEQVSVVGSLSEQQISKLKLLSHHATQKYNDFEKQVNKLYTTVPSSEDIDSDKVSELQNAISGLFVDIQSTCNTLLPPIQPETLDESSSNVLPSTPVHQTIKLPQISLPTFSGNPEQWVTFQGLFESSVHKNESISNIEKFSYLLSCLSDEAFNLIKSLPLNSANYLIAWQTLVKRYHNTRLLISLHTNNILDLPQLLKPTMKQLRDFISLFYENQQALKALGHDITGESLILTSHVLRKFDPTFRSEFEHKRGDSKQVPTIDEVIKFLENECSYLEAANMGTMSKANYSPQVKSFVGFKKADTYPTKPVVNSRSSRVVMFSANNVYNNCTYCASNSHNVYRCPDFAAITPNQRHTFIKDKNLCQNCFGNHKLEMCKSTHSCRVCMKRHHTLLHFNKQDRPQLHNKFVKTSATHVLSNNNNKTMTLLPAEANSSSTLMGLSCGHINTVLLATALVQVTAPNGNQTVVRAVLDSASQSTLLSENCANILGLKRSHIGVPEITGISSAQVKPKGLAFVTLSSLGGAILASEHPVIILDKIANDLPRVKLSPDVKLKLRSYVLADPTFDTPGPIDILIGADLFAQALIGPTISLGNDMPFTIKTVFGYVVLGKSPVAYFYPPYTGVTTLLSLSDLDLHASLKQFWILEEPPHTKQLSPQDELCEKHFLSTHYRDDTGRYICRLPLCKDPAELGDSSILAQRMLKSLERKFETQSEFKQMYVDFMSDYKVSGHMKLCELESPPPKPHYFLPHHGVLKDGKIRVVFNASAPTSTGVTLNSIQHQGPKLHNEIIDIILRFRQYKIAFVCDIKQMFRMISIHEDDQRFQLIYWREDSSLPLSVYQLTTVTYGMSSSPFLANRVVQQLIHDEEDHHPLAANALKKQIYVDDALLGSQTLEGALQLQQDVIQLLKKGGFELRKWTSNSKELLENLPLDHCLSPHIFKSSDQPFVSILGLKWNPETDTFSYIIEKPSMVLTKRALLSTIAKIYDVTGMLAPLIFWAKALMQHVWTLGLDWDTPLPDDVADRWLTFITELPEIENLRIARCLLLAGALNIQLHGFSDASELGFAACVYLGTEDANGTVSVNLLIAKSRVAPLKRITVPRLELCGAHILAKLLHYCVEQFSDCYKLNSVTAWSDSTIALSWIHTPSYRLKLFVANRVAQIQELIPSCTWKHVSTNDNPADSASRGLTASLLIQNDQWWFGPQWLKTSPTVWEDSSFHPVSEEDLPEIKTASLNLMATTEDQGLDFINKFSSWKTLLHVMGYVLRFISCLKLKKRITHPLTLQELENSNNRVCWLIQKSCFSNEITLLTKKKECSNRIQRLAPFLDPSDILRVGGRLRNSSLSFCAKHQIILPKKHPVVYLIIDHYHKEYLHAGPQLLQAALREKYWILSARSVIRTRIFRCIRCFKIKPKLNTPLMGDLPLKRVTPSRPFNATGVDYAGPFTVKLYHLRRLQPIKVYLCLFICFATKAVHLEVVTDLTSEAYIAALTRFISRRGLVKDIHCDCGTNFVGAAATLKKSFEELLHKPETQHFAEENNISFHFLPPHAPHQGGLWERAVRSAKHHLHRVVGAQVLTYEEFITLTARVEAMLNSRPLTPLSADPNDLEPLTPGHFLVGGPLKSIIEPQLNEVNCNRLRRWQLVQAFSQHIWTRWQQEYLNTLQQRPKWLSNQENLKIDDLVVMHDPNSPPLKWKLGRITAVSPGADGVVRVVHLRTATGNFSRPAVKVSLLPIY